MDTDMGRKHILNEVNKIFDEMEKNKREWRGALLAVVYSGEVETVSGTSAGDGVAHLVVGHPADNVVLAGAASMLSDEVKRRLLINRKHDYAIG